MDIDYFRNKLAARQVELQEMIAGIEDQLDDPKPQSFSEQAVEREDDEVLQSREKAEFEELRAIEAALKRVENGAYGICLNCGNEISVERLEAVPHAIHCRDCMV